MGAIQKNRSIITTTALFSLLVSTVLMAGYISKTSSHNKVSLCGAKQICYNHHADLDSIGHSADITALEGKCDSCGRDCNDLQCENCEAESQSHSIDTEMSVNEI
jgi:hypothetical protein